MLNINVLELFHNCFTKTKNKVMMGTDDPHENYSKTWGEIDRDNAEWDSSGTQESEDNWRKVLEEREAEKQLNRLREMGPFY